MLYRSSRWLLFGSFFVPSVLLGQSVKIQLPLEGGYKARCVQGVGGCYSHIYDSTRHDIDLDTSNVQDEVVLVPVSGWAYANYDDGFGNHINVDLGDGTFINISHLKSFMIADRQWVHQGEVIGIEGTTGNSQGDHIHFGRHAGDPDLSAAQSISVPMSGVLARYMGATGADESFPFENFSGDEFIGPPNNPECDSSPAQGHFYQSGNYREMHYHYPTATRFRDTWNKLAHGFAITPLYEWQGHPRQDFQHVYMTFNTVTGQIEPPVGWICPGMTAEGWNWEVTPYFVEAYNKHGRATVLGHPTSSMR